MPQKCRTIAFRIIAIFCLLNRYDSVSPWVRLPSAALLKAP
nr:MAG TPA: hypothetical protein [Caudoviricetes sp.]